MGGRKSVDKLLEITYNFGRTALAKRYTFLQNPVIFSFYAKKAPESVIGANSGVVFCFGSVYVGEHSGQDRSLQAVDD